MLKVYVGTSHAEMSMKSTMPELQSVLRTLYTAKWHMYYFWWIVWIANVKSGKCLMVAFALWCMGFYCSSSDAAINYSPFYWTASDSAGVLGGYVLQGFSKVKDKKKCLQNLKCEGYGVSLKLWRNCRINFLWNWLFRKSKPHNGYTAK